MSFERLRKIPLLESLDDVELSHLNDVLRERKVPKGNFIVYANEPAPSMMFLLDGTVKVTLLSGDGKEIVLANLLSGDFFGELALLTGEDRSANVVATSDCVLLVLYEEDFKQHIVDNSGLSLAMMKELALRLRTASTKIGDLALYDVYRRVARTLKSLGRPEEIDGEKILVIDDRPTHQELAAMVGTSREMVTRALKGLEEDGCTKTDGKRVEIVRLPR